MNLEALFSTVCLLGFAWIAMTMVPWGKLKKLRPSQPEVVNKDLSAKVVDLRHHMACLSREDRNTGLDACDTIDELLAGHRASHLEPVAARPPMEV